MLRSLLVGAAALGLAACANGAAKDAAPGGANGATGDGSTVAAGRGVEAGTRVEATIQTALNSRKNGAGESVRAVVSRDVLDARGRVAIPAGSTVTLKVLQLEPGSDQTRPDGRLSLAVSSLTIDGTTYPADATLDPVAHHLEGRGITKDEALRVGAGTAIGALAGQAISKNQRGTVIGGAVGAVAGTAVAVRYAYRDVVVTAGTPIAFTFTNALNLSAR